MSTVRAAPAPPAVSVVIPAFNQAGYLREAVDSVLAQSFADLEIIVIDDGSTDETPQVIAGYGSAVRAVRQVNRGLACARNAGLSLARGRLVALLDSDDAWLPAYLSSMLPVVARHPEAAVYYCGVSYVDEAGRPLPQTGRIGPFAQPLSAVMLRANPLVPSATILRRAAVVAAGGFDPAFRRLQDWELWVRLLRAGHQIVGCPDALVRYRVHGASLSADDAGGRAAAHALVLKHFGVDAGDASRWPAEKRRAYGGYYRYCALSRRRAAVRQTADDAPARPAPGAAVAADLQRAFAADPALAEDIDLAYELALGPQPLGFRGLKETALDLDATAKALERLAEAITAPPSPAHVVALRRTVEGTFAFACALLAYERGAAGPCSASLRRALTRRASLWRDPRTARMAFAGLVGDAGLARVQRLARLVTGRERLPRTPRLPGTWLNTRR